MLDTAPKFVFNFIGLKKSHGLTSSEVELYGLIYFYAEKSYLKPFNLTNGEVAEILYLSSGAVVNNMLTKLQKVGLIERVVRRAKSGTTRVIRIVKTPLENSEPNTLKNVVGTEANTHTDVFGTQKNSGKGSRISIYNNIIYNSNNLESSAASPRLDGGRAQNSGNEEPKNLLQNEVLQFLLPPCSPLDPMSKIKMTSLPDSSDVERAPRKLVNENELRVLRVYKACVFAQCTDKTKSAVDLIPPTIKLYEDAFGKEHGVGCLIESIKLLSENRRFRDLKLKDVRIVAPANFFRKTFVENNLIPFGQKHYDATCNPSSSSVGRDSALRDKILREADFVVNLDTHDEGVTDIVL